MAASCIATERRITVYNLPPRIGFIYITADSHSVYIYMQKSAILTARYSLMNIFAKCAYVLPK